MAESVSVLANILLRGATLFGRFCFIFVAAKYLPLDELGSYSLIAVTVGYALYLVGLDFYTYSTRQVIGNPESIQANLILNQFRVYLLSFALASPVLLILFIYDFLHWQWAAYFYALLLTEHFSQEIFRLLVALGRPLRASVILFLRTAGWGYIVSLLFFLDASPRTLETILQLWLVSSVLSLLAGLLWLPFVPWTRLFESLPDRRWVLQGMKVALPFLVSTLAIRAIFTLDRYAIETLDGIATVGVYTVYAGLAYAMFAFVDASVIQFSYPRLVESMNSGSQHTFPRLMTQFAVKILGSIAICAGGLIFTAHFILGSLGKPEYLLYLDDFWWIVAAYSLWLLSYIPHYGLYAMKKDRWIFAGHLLPLFVFIPGVFFLPIESGISRVAITLFFTFLLSLGIKTLGFLPQFRKIVHQYANSPKPTALPRKSGI